MTGKVSHVKQYLAEQEKKSKVKPHILPNRTHRSNSLDRRDSVDSTLNSNFSKVTKDLATFKNGKGVSLSMSDVYSFQFFEISITYIVITLLLLISLQRTSSRT